MKILLDNVILLIFHEFLDEETFECGNTYLNTSTLNLENIRSKRETVTSHKNTEIYVETAVFVDKDLFNHMTTIFTENTEKELIRFVLALINAVSKFFIFLKLLTSSRHF